MSSPGPNAKECPHCDMGIESAKCDCDVDEPDFWNGPDDDPGTLGLKSRQQEREEWLFKEKNRPYLIHEIIKSMRGEH